MRNGSLAIITLLLGLIVGGAAGFLFGSTQPGQVTAAAPVLQVQTAGVDARLESGPSVGVGSELAAPAKRSAPSAAGGFDPDAQAAAIDATASRQSASVAARVQAEVMATADPSWNGVITGEVVNDLGEPMAGATVITRGIQSWYDGRVSVGSTEKLGRAYQGRRPLEEQLLETAKKIEKARLTLPETLTDEAGRFALESLEPGTHSIAAYAEGFTFATARAATGGAVRLLGSKVGAFELDIRLPDGSAPDEAVVFVLEADGSEKAAARWKKDQPVVRLKTPRAQVRIMSGEVYAYEYSKHAGEFVSDPFSLDLQVDADTAKAVELRPMTQLRVAVRDESSALPHVDPWVKVRSTDGEASAEPVKLERRRGKLFIAVDLQVGAYEVQVGRGSETPESTTEVEVAAGMNETEVVLGEIDGSSFIVITCRDDAGQPVTDAKLSYQAKSGQSTRNGSIYNPETRSAGEYWVGWSKVLQNALPNDETSVLITAATGTFGSQSKKVDADGRVDFVFAAPCELTVEVMNAPTGKIQVVAQRIEDESSEGNPNLQTSPKASMDTSGRALVGKCQPGRYKVLARVQQSQWQFSDAVAEQEVTLSAGETTLRLMCSELHELVVLAPDLEPGANLNLQRIDSDSESGMSHAGHKEVDASGRVVFPGLTAGDYLLMSWGSGESQQMEITLPCGEVTFEPMEINGFMVTSVTPDKAAARAGLQVGDVVIGSGERRAKGDSMFFNRLWLEMGDGPTEVTVLRGGREVQLEIEELAGGTNTWSELGMNLRPTSEGRR
jgi:hypothetical protein